MAVVALWLVGVTIMLTKRRLGLLFILAGVAGAGALMAIDWLGAGAFQGVGPAQRAGLLVAGFLTLVGLSLLPLGDRPA